MWHRQYDIEVHPPKRAILDLTASCINWRFCFQHIDRWENNVGLKSLDQWQCISLAFRSHAIQFSMQTSCYDSHFLACSFIILHSEVHSRLSSDCKHCQKSFLSVYSSRALVDLGRFLSFLICTQCVGPPWTGEQPVSRPLPTHRTTQTQNKRTQTSMPRVGLEPTIPVFERAKAVHALDLAANVICRNHFTLFK
jgi:hypothetical protein